MGSSLTNITMLGILLYIAILYAISMLYTKNNHYNGNSYIVFFKKMKIQHI